MKRRDEVTVGILITVALVVLVVGALWLARGGLSSGYPLNARFAWGQNLKQGQPVMLAGVTIGYVSDVRLRDDGFLDADLRVNNEYRVPRNAVAEVVPVGIFGDAAIALKATGPSEQSFAAGDTVPTRSATSGLDALTGRADSIMLSVNRITRAIEGDFVEAGGFRDMRTTMANMNRLVAQMSGVVAEQNRNLTATMASLRSATSGVDSAQIATTLSTFRTTAASADSLMQRLSSNTTQLQAILARLERGEGTVGKFMTDTMLYRDARNLLTRMDSLMADFQRNPRKYINLTIF
ncbi:MAG TPA: MlaD family protein [Gemmatimonadaceae bacterium]|nr:MlaD family protein [Gemmatimonadaceae bacterium]